VAGSSHVGSISDALALEQQSSAVLAAELQP